MTEHRLNPDSTRCVCAGCKQEGEVKMGEAALRQVVVRVRAEGAWPLPRRAVGAIARRLHPRKR